MSTVFNDPTPSAVQPRSTEQSNLELSDLQNLLMIVDVASQRGAFKGPELSQIGQVFDRVAKFLQNTLPPAEQQTATPAAQPQVAPVISEQVPPFFQTGGNK